MYRNKTITMSKSTITSTLISALVKQLVSVGTNAVEGWKPFPSPQGIYEVLEHTAELELLDSQGEIAIYRKLQRVRFLQNNVIAYYDTAWGDGEIFAEYQCSPGVPVDRFREGHRYKVLISLRQTKQNGDQETFHIRRVIKCGFQANTEFLQTDIYHRTHALKVNVVFPSSRHPHNAQMTEAHDRRTVYVAEKEFRRLPDGRIEISWQKLRPRVRDSYILTWEW